MNIKKEVCTMVHKVGDVEYYREAALQAAKDLLYPETVIERLKVAESSNEISRIMVTCRKKYL